MSCPHRSSPPRWLRAAALLGALATGTLCQAAPLDLWGAFASGNARQCPGGLCGGGSIESLNDGGFLDTAAAVEMSAAVKAAHPGVDFKAEAVLSGGLDLPLLRALAQAESSSRYTVGAQAKAYQYYVYDGAVPLNAVLDVVLDGTMTGNAQLSGFVLVLEAEGFDPEGEVPGVRLANSSFVWSAGSVNAQPAALAFTLDPGDEIYIYAALFASADSRNQTPSTADAFHTLTMSFQDPTGLTSGTAIAANSVPLPGTLALLAAGLLAGVPRRRPH